MSSFSLQYHPWIKHLGNKNKGADHQLQKLLIMKLILCQHPVKCIENSMENMYVDL